MPVPADSSHPSMLRGPLRPWGAAAKRLFDLVAALLGIAVLAPLMLGISLLLLATMGAPVLYRGKRTGRFGRPFEMLKFRTMVPNAESLGGTTTGQNDPRITRTGRLLRAYKLDELPQLFNVVKGDMSFVGPRPEVAEYTDHYQPAERRILSVRPGITDLASLEFSDLQASLGAGDPDIAFRQRVLPRKIELRLKYVDEQSFFGDLAIVAKTVAVVASKPFRKAA